jgi:hypothetical protein
VLLAAAVVVAVLAAGLLWSLGGRDTEPEAATADGAGSPVSLSPRAEATQTPTGQTPTGPAQARSATATVNRSPAQEIRTTALPGAVNSAGVNLALHRPATASGSEGPPWYPAFAVDGKADTRWSSGFSDPQWITVDLGRQWQINKIRLSWERAYAVAYEVQLSADGHTWSTVYSTGSGQGGEVTVDPDRIVLGRYVRVYGTKRNGQYGYSLFEIDVR